MQRAVWRSCPNSRTWYWKGVLYIVVECVRPMVSHRTKPEARGKERKVRSVNRRTEQQGEKGVLLLEGKDLDTGEGLPINPVPSWLPNWPKKPRPANSAPRHWHLSSLLGRHPLDVHAFGFVFFGLHARIFLLLNTRLLTLSQYTSSYQITQRTIKVSSLIKKKISQANLIRNLGPAYNAFMLAVQTKWKERNN